MMEMHNVWKDLKGLSDTDTEATLKEIYKAMGITNPLVQHKLFGAFIGSATDTFESEIGKSISRENPLLQLIMYYPELVSKDGKSKDFFHRIGVYRTTRIEFLATFLNEHTDKNFARAVIQGTPISIDTGTAIGEKLKNKMLHSILDETNLDAKQLLDPKFDPALEKLINGYRDLFINGTDVEAQAEFMTDVALNIIGKDMRQAENPGFNGNVFTTLSILHGLSDLRDSQHTGKPLKTSYRIKPDAATSGVILTFAQGIGKDVTKGSPEDHVLKMFDRLGYTKDMIGKTPELKDAYYLLLNAAKKASLATHNADTVTFAIMEDLERLKIFKKIRDLAKPMTMVTNYQAGDTTAVYSTSKELADSVIDYLMSNTTTVDGSDYIKNMIKSTDDGKLFYEKHDIDSLKSWEIADLEGVHKHITQYFVKNLSEQLREFIKKELAPSTGKYKDRLSRNYLKLEKVFMEDIKDKTKNEENSAKLAIIPAMTWMYLNSVEREKYDGIHKNVEELDSGTITQEEFNNKMKDFAIFQREMIRKYSMPLTSRRQVMSVIRGKNVMHTKEAPNALTAAVNAIHSVDSAIFFKSHIDTEAEINDILSQEVKDSNGKIISLGKYDPSGNRDHANGIPLTKNERAGFITALHNASGMIHDANLADPYYSLIYEPHYRENSIFVSSNYDVEEQLAFTYASYYLENSVGVNDEYSHKHAVDMLRSSKDGVNKKKEALKNIDEKSIRFFGFPDTEPTSDPSKLRPVPTKKTRTSTEDNKEFNDEFLGTAKGGAELEASEKENGPYDPGSQTHKEDKKPYSRLMRTKFDTKVKTETYSWDESVKIMDKEADYIVDLVESGNPYFMMDIESSWSTDENPLNNSRILEFYAEEYIGGVPTGKTIHHKFLPEFPIQYDNTTRGKNYSKYSYFKDGVSEHIGSDGTSQFYTKEGYNAFLDDIINELGNPNDLRFVAYNGFNFDFETMRKAFDSKYNMNVLSLYDPMLLNLSVNKGLSVENDATNRKLGDQHGRLPVGSKTKINSEDTHAAGVDTLMMHELMMHDIKQRKKQEAKEEAKKGSSLGFDDNQKTEYDVAFRRTEEELSKAIDDIISEDKDAIINTFIKKYGYNNATSSSYNEYIDMISISNSPLLTNDQLMIQILHEIAHQKSTGFVGANPSDVDVKYLSDNIDRIKQLGSEIIAGVDSKSMRRRIANKIINEPNDTRALLELIAIFETEPETVDAFASALSSKTFKARVHRLIRKIVDFFNGRNEEVDLAKILKAVNNTVEKGEVFNDTDQVLAKAGRAKIRKQLGDDATIAYDAVSHNQARRDLLDANSYRRLKTKNKNDTFVEKKWRSANRISGIYANQLLYNLVAPTSEFIGSGVHTKLKKKSKVYRQTVNAIEGHWMGQAWLQSLKTYIDRSRVGDLYAMNLMEKMQMDSEQQMATFETETISELKDLMKNSNRVDENGNPVLDKKGKPVPFTDEDINDIGRVVAHSPIFHLMDIKKEWYSIINSDDSTKKIQDLIIDIESDPNNAPSPSMISDAISIAKIVTKQELTRTDTVYNVEQMNIDDIRVKKNVQKLVALYAIQLSENSDNAIKQLKNNKELTDKFTALSLSLKVITDEVVSGTVDKQAFRESIVYEQFEKPKEFRAINEYTNIQIDYPYNEGWRVLRQPSKHGYGVVYKNTDKSTIQTGAGTSENFKYYDVLVDEKIRKQGNINGAVKIYNGTNDSYHKVVLTASELEKVGDNVSNPADMLARAYAQMIMIKGTMTARNFILYGDKIESIKTKSEASRFNKKVKKMDITKKPWFLKIPDGKTVEQFMEENPNIAMDYKEPDQISNINDFSNSITLVRKDMNDMIMGYKDPTFFDGNDLGRKLFYAIRQSVILIKQTWIMLNPKKVLNDIASNQVILAAYGVPIQSIVKDQAKSLKLSASMSKLRTDFVMLEFEIRGETDDAKKSKLEANRDSIVNKMEKHPMAPIYQNGMVQSISTDILMKDRSVVTGLQQDVENILNIVLKHNNGKPSDISKAISVFADMGISVDDIVKNIGTNTKKIKMFGEFGKRVGKAMEASGERVQKKKKNKDMAKYLSEFIGSPDSEILRIGSYMVTMADVASRYALYNHLRKNSGKIDVSTKKQYKQMNEEEIVETVLEAFVDYKVNLPKELKVTSDYGVLMFPSFWLRIQKVIYAISKDNPLKIAAGLTLQEVLDIHVDSYFDSNIFSKAGDIVNMPPVFTDPVDMLFPTKLIEQLSLGTISF